tara:strand:- start:160 stop:315 length:156 start_codon:yes stop_codon:yes gene_type:complete
MTDQTKKQKTLNNNEKKPIPLARDLGGIKDPTESKQQNPATPRRPWVAVGV